MLSRDRPVAPALSRSASVDRSYGLSASASSSGSGAGSRSDRDGQWKVEAHSGAYGNCAFLVGASIKYNSVTHETTARDRIEGSPEQAVRRETVSHIVERWAAYNDQCGITTDQIIGDVQSGKTEQMVACIAKAVDHGYDGCVIFSGAENPLRAQTQKRFDYYFANTSHVHDQSQIDKTEMSMRDSRSPWVWLTNEKDIVNTAPAALMARSRDCLSYLDRDQPEKLPKYLKMKSDAIGQPAKFLAVVKKSAVAMQRYFDRVVKPLADDARRTNGARPRVLYLDDESDDRSVYGSRKAPARKNVDKRAQLSTHLTGNKVARMLHEISSHGHIRKVEGEEPDEEYDADEEINEALDEAPDAPGSASHLPSVVADDSPQSWCLRSLMLRFTATPQANIFERKDSHLAPHDIWLLERPAGNQSYMGLDHWFSTVPIRQLFTRTTRDNNYDLVRELRERTPKQLDLMARTPLQVIPYCDWHNYGPTQTVRYGSNEQQLVDILPLNIKTPKGPGRQGNLIESRQIRHLEHILQLESSNGFFDPSEVPNRIPASMLQALCDFLFTGAVYRYRRRAEEDLKARKKVELLTAAALRAALVARSTVMSDGDHPDRHSLCVRLGLNDPHKHGVLGVLKLLDALAVVRPADFLAKYMTHFSRLSADIQCSLSIHSTSVVMYSLPQLPAAADTYGSPRWVLPECSSPKPDDLRFQREKHQLLAHLLAILSVRVTFLVPVRRADGEIELQRLRLLHETDVSVKPEAQVKCETEVCVVVANQGDKEVFWYSSDAAVQAELRSVAERAEYKLGAPLERASSMDGSSGSGSAASLKPKLDAQHRDLEANARKWWHAALFQVSGRLKAQELLTQILTQAWFLIADRMRIWLSRHKETRMDLAEIDRRSPGETAPDLKQRVREMFPEAAKRLERMKAELEAQPAVQSARKFEQHKAMAKQVDKLEEAFTEQEDKLAEMQQLAEEGDADKLSEYAIIDQILDAQWERLEARMEIFRIAADSKGERCIPPALHQLVADLCYISNHGVVRRGNTAKAAGPLVEQRLWVLDYDLTEPRTDPVPECMILVGSNLHTRGITIEGLRVTYFARANRCEATDTTIQQGRWFGHRRPLERDLCTLFIQERAALTFMALALHHNLLRSDVKAFIRERKDITRDVLVLHCVSYMKLSNMSDTMVRLMPKAVQMLQPKTSAVKGEDGNNMTKTEAFISKLRAAAASQSPSVKGMIVRTIGAHRGAEVFYEVDVHTALAYLSSVHVEPRHPENQCSVMHAKLRAHLNQCALREQQAGKPVTDMLHVVVLPIKEEQWRDSDGFPKLSTSRRYDSEDKGFSTEILYDAIAISELAQQSSLYGQSARLKWQTSITAECADWFEFESAAALFDDGEGSLDYTKPVQLERRKPDAPHLLVIRRLQPVQLLQLARENSPSSSMSASAVDYLPALCYVSSAPAAEVCAAAYNAQAELNLAGLDAIGQVPQPSVTRQVRTTKSPAKGAKAEAARELLARIMRRREQLSASTLTRSSRLDILQEYRLEEDGSSTDAATEAADGSSESRAIDVRDTVWVQTRKVIKDDTRELNMVVKGDKRLTAALLMILEKLATMPKFFDAEDEESSNALFEPWIEFDAREEQKDSDADPIECFVLEDRRAPFDAFLCEHRSWPVCLYLIEQWLKEDQYEHLSDFEEDLLVVAFNWLHFYNRTKAAQNNMRAFMTKWKDLFTQVLLHSQLTQAAMTKILTIKAANSAVKAANQAKGKPKGTKKRKAKSPKVNDEEEEKKGDEPAARATKVRRQLLLDAGSAASSSRLAAPGSEVPAARRASGAPMDLSAESDDWSDDMDWAPESGSDSDASEED